MNVSDLIAYTRDLTGVYSPDIVSDALLTRFLSEAHKEVLRQGTWPFLVVTTFTYTFSDQTSWIIPDCRYILDVLYTDEAGKVTRGVPVTVLPLAPEKDVTFQYAVSGPELTFAPAAHADAHLTARYVASVPSLNLPEDVPTLPEDYHSMLAYRAALKVLSMEGDTTSRAKAYSDEYGTLMSSLREEYLLDHDRAFPQVGVPAGKGTGL